MKPLPIEPFCLRCKRKVLMLEPIKRHTKNGRYLYIGKCSECGIKVSLIRQEARGENYDR